MISDYFAEDLIGGASLNDEEVVKIFAQEGEKIQKIRSDELSVDFLKENKESFFIVSNFFHMSPECRKELMSLNYLIYAHDYKFVRHMNPAAYENFLVPKEDLINVPIFKKSKAVICQSSLQKKIYDDNIDGLNCINFSGNLWSEETLALLESLSSKEKKPVVSVVKSKWPQKGVPESISFCLQENYDYDLVYDDDYYRFLWKLSENQALAFYPLTPETCSRVTLECKMMNIKVFITKLVGASHEPWFEKHGVELINFMREKKKEIYELISKVAHD